MRAVIGLIAGVIFGTGLIVSGMSDPAKVLNFLDIFGTWDPSLAFVMGGATTTTFVGYRLLNRRAKPIAAPAFQTPSGLPIDRPLVTGAALFGAGWGLGGFCPGPAWTALPLAEPGTLIFIPAMLLGLLIGRRNIVQSFVAGDRRHV